MKQTIRSIFVICCACISFYIGAGFATMQEIVQYEASYGIRFVLVILVAAIIYIYTNLSFATNANRLKLKRGGDIYGVYCKVLGKTVGKCVAFFFDMFATMFCYMSFVVMCGGANATASQQWQLPWGWGAVILTIAVIITVLGGLEGIVNALGKMGPVIIVMILIVAITTSITGWKQTGVNLAAINAGKYVAEMKQVGNGNPVAAGASYGGFVILWFASFMAEMGIKKKLNQIHIGMILSTFFIFGTAIVCCIALIGHIGIVATADIPALTLAESVSPILAQAFAIVICAGIYTSAVPLLWTGIRKISSENTARYKTLTVVGGIVGCMIACFVSYKRLINVLYGLNGYMGFVLVIFMIIYDIKTRMSSKGWNE